MQLQEKARYMSGDQLAEAQREFIQRVYTWMVGGLLLTAFTAWLASTSSAVMSLVTGPLGIVIMLSPLVMVFVLSGRIDKMSKEAAMGSFAIFSALIGLSLSTLLLVYAKTTIYNTFLITAGMFGALSLYGYTTKKDLTGVGRFMFMGLIGIILASIVNLFIASSAINFIVSVAGVLIFSGLTAYDTQKIKEMYVVLEQGEEIATKSAIMGALRLYLDFINLFLFLLRFMGGGRN